MTLTKTGEARKTSAMVRSLRIQRVGAWYHVTGRGLERRSIFADAKDRSNWLGLLAEASDLWRLVVHGYAQVENHYHLVLETWEPNRVELR